MRQELSKETAAELHDLAKTINDRENTLQQLKQQTVNKANEALSEAVLQGYDLLKAKSQIPHGLFLQWLASNCPNVKQAQAYVYMRIASNLCRGINLSQADSLKGALRLIAEEQEKPEAKQEEKWAPYLDGIYRFTKALSFVERNPLDSWPQEGKEKLKEELKPIVVCLWPELNEGIAS